MTPDNDERGPLESWLSDEVRPLPPPPGTFQLITRRARRRKLRRLAITVGSAAAVAAAVAIAVPNAVALHLTQPSATGAPAADGSRPPAGATQQRPDGSASQFPPTATPVSSAGGGIVPPSGQVPPNFAPVSVTFVSTRTGWVIGQAGTPGHCATQYCTSIARTDNAGQSWVGVPAPLTGAADGPTGVSGIRFLDGVNGWAFGPELWATHDDGRTWQQISTGGQRVTDLETAGDRAYALFASCSGSGGTGFAADCTSDTLMTTTAGSDDWTAVGGATSGLVSGGSAASAQLALTGSDGYLLAPDGTLYSGPLGGTWQNAGTAPCQPGTPQANGLPSGAFLALVSSSRLALACPGPSDTSPPKVYTSDDSGATWTQSSDTWPGTGTAVMTSLAAAPDGTLVLATTTGTFVLPNGASQWQQAKGTPQGGFSYVGMTADSQGVAVPADTSLHEIWMTFDGGLTWTASPIS
jgi:hypothetical protein